MGARVFAPSSAGVACSLSKHERGGFHVSALSVKAMASCENHLVADVMRPTPPKRSAGIPTKLPSPPPPVGRCTGCALYTRPRAERTGTSRAFASPRFTSIPLRDPATSVGLPGGAAEERRQGLRCGLRGFHHPLNRGGEAAPPLRRRHFSLHFRPQHRSRLRFTSSLSRCDAGSKTHPPRPCPAPAPPSRSS